MRQRSKIALLALPSVRKILCPVDRSEISERTLKYAAMLSRRYGASLTALEVVWIGAPSVPPVWWPPSFTGDQLEELRDGLQRFVVNATSDPTIDVRLRVGPVVNDILEEARTLQADVIVLGTHGRTGFERFVLGSVTEKILRKAHCPVFTVPPHMAHTAREPQPFKSVLCPIDFSPLSLQALGYALSLAQESGKRLVLVHVFDWPPDRPVTPVVQADRRRDEDAALRELHGLVPESARAWCECEEVTASGRPYEEILNIAEARGSDLIVLGVHGRSQVGLAIFGSTVNQLIRRATCPVLTVRT